jgi:hypothetical protein
MSGERFMRAILTVLSVAVVVACITPALAEKQIFIVANNADGYGIDRCLAEGASCGTAAAGAYCRSHAFSQAVSFRKVDRDDTTGAIPVTDGAGCRGAHCDAFVAIECNR